MGRKLRITFSALCGIVGLLLIVWWARSFWYQDYICGWLSNSHSVSCISGRGWSDITWSSNDLQRSDPTQLPSSEVTGILIEEWGEKTSPESEWSWQYFSHCEDHHFSINMPYWLPVLMVAALAIVPWIGWSKRFRLRTLLIATTLMVMLLGAVVYTIR